jgi:rod shape-determining protein MreB and related proteins
MSLGQLFVFSPQDVAIDLGTANTIVYLRGQGIVIDEPSVVAVEVSDGVRRVLAVGDDAKLMMGRTHHHISTIRPLRNGVIADLEMAEQMIRHFIRKAQAGQSAFFARGPEIVICVPSAATPVELRAIRAAAFNAGARHVWLIEEPMAAALGAGLPVHGPVGSMVVDIGGGTTEVGVVALGGLIYSNSARVGGDRMDEAIAAYVRRAHNLLIGEATAERIKKEIGSARATAGSNGATAFVSGRDVAEGGPRETTLSQAEIAGALSEPVSHIVDFVRAALEQIQPEIAADVIDRGITMTGGGSLLRNIDAVLADETGLPVQIADKALRCVALGAGRALEDAEYRGALQPA